MHSSLSLMAVLQRTLDNLTVRHKTEGTVNLCMHARCCSRLAEWKTTDAALTLKELWAPLAAAVEAVKSLGSQVRCPQGRRVRWCLQQGRLHAEQTAQSNVYCTPVAVLGSAAHRA